MNKKHKEEEVPAEETAAAPEEVKAAPAEEPKAEGVEVPDGAKITVTGGGVKEGEPVDVVDREGTYVRTYDPAVHGDAYMQLAKQFIGKVNSVARGYTLRAHDPKNV